MKLQKEILQFLAIAAHKTFMDIVPPDMLKRSTLGTLTTDHSSQVHPTMSPFCPFPVLIAAVHFSVFYRIIRIKYHVWAFSAKYADTKENRRY